MPLVASGSIFAQLQALAMAGTGIGTITVAAGAIGGVAGATYLKDFCAFVDETDPDSVMGKTIDASVTTVTTAIKTKDILVAQCSSSEICTATVDATTEIVAATGKFVATLFDGFVKGFKEGLAEKK
jgi:TM2 domain-containing membrane protein YozV